MHKIRIFFKMNFNAIGKLSAPFMYHEFCIYWQKVNCFKTQTFDWWLTQPNNWEQFSSFLGLSKFWSDTFDPQMTYCVIIFQI